MARSMNVVFVHAGYFLMLVGLAVRDVLWLRGVLVVAQLMLALYASRMGTWSVAGWNALFVVINLTWAVILIRERRAVALPANLKSIHERHFFALPPGEFLRWWRGGRAATLAAGTVLTIEGGLPDALYFVTSGVARVSHRASPVIDLGAGHFVGEMSLITGRAATADVVAATPLSVRTWPIADLHTLRDRDPVRWSHLQSAIGQDLVVKLADMGSEHAPSGGPPVPLPSQAHQG